jgi:hypothetical protein
MHRSSAVKTFSGYHRLIRVDPFGRGRLVSPVTQSIHLMETEVAGYLEDFINDADEELARLFQPDAYAELVRRVMRIEAQSAQAAQAAHCGDADTRATWFTLVYKSIGTALKAHRLKSTLTGQVQTLRAKLEEKERLKKATSVSIGITDVVSSIDPFAVMYLIRYGQPKDGIYDPQKFAELTKYTETVPEDEWVFAPAATAAATTASDV